MEIVILVLSVGIAVCGIATLAYVVKQGRAERQQMSEETLRRLLAEQAAETARQIQMVREELTRTMRELLAENRMELSGRVEALRKEGTGNQALQLQHIQETLNRNLLTTNELQREKLEAMTHSQELLVQSTEKRLDEMRLMVEEKLMLMNF